MSSKTGPLTGQKTPLAKKLGLLVGLGFCSGVLLAIAVWLLRSQPGKPVGMMGFSDIKA